MGNVNIFLSDLEVNTPGSLELLGMEVTHHIAVMLLPLKGFTL